MTGKTFKQAICVLLSESQNKHVLQCAVFVTLSTWYHKLCAEYLSSTWHTLYSVQLEPGALRTLILMRILSTEH